MSAGLRFPITAALALAPEVTHGEIADRVGVHVSTITRWARRGLNEWQADEVAIAVGSHPAAIWPEWADVPALGVVA